MFCIAFDCKLRSCSFEYVLHHTHSQFNIYTHKNGKQLTQIHTKKITVIIITTTTKSNNQHEIHSVQLFTDTHIIHIYTHSLIHPTFTIHIRYIQYRNSRSDSSAIDRFPVSNYIDSKQSHADNSN